MRKLEGLKWKELTDEEKRKLYIIGNVDKDNVDENTGECIVDFGEDLSISGIIVYGEMQELLIDDDAILYNPVAY